MSLERSIRKLAAVANAFSSMEICTTSGCNQLVSKPGYKLCYECWKINNLASRSTATPKPQPKPKTSSSPVLPSLLSATKISEKLALHNHNIHRNNVNRILAELGLLTKEKNGWLVTRRGASFGAVQKTDSETGNTYVVWSESILENQVFIQTIAEYVSSSNPESNTAKAIEEQGFRNKFRTQANLRTTDGHWVRSKAEVMIDNWLYMAELVHAYERRLPIEEEMYCDFYVPAGKVYIEYWGLENNPEYAERKKAKKSLYQKYEFKLIELSDTEIRNLDDYLPRMLLNFGVVVN